MDEMQAAALSLKLPALKDENERRRAIALHYIEGIVNPKVKLPCGANEVGESVWHIFPLRSAERERLQEHLKACGVETMTHYPVPPHRQEAMKGIVEGSFPVTERWADEELSLPIAPYLTDEEIERVIEAVNEAPDFKL
jgi:dTDP-4-amino-4,6-dideoxygalactose transaminase